MRTQGTSHPLLSLLHNIPRKQYGWSRPKPHRRVSYNEGSKYLRCTFIWLRDLHCPHPLMQEDMLDLKQIVVLLLHFAVLLPEKNTCFLKTQAIPRKTENKYRASAYPPVRFEQVENLPGCKIHSVMSDSLWPHGQ